MDGLFRYTVNSIWSGNVGDCVDKRDKDGLKRDSYDHIVKYTGVFGGVQGLVVLITAIRTKIVSVLLGTVGFGINESFNRIVNLVKSTTDLGVPFSAVRTISANYDGENEGCLTDSILVTRSWALLTAIAGALLLALLSPLFSLWAFDGDRGYTLSFLMLSPVVAFSAVNGGEMAILKGSRRLREIAMSQLLTAVLTLSISVPVIWMLGLRGLVPSLVLVSFASMSATCFFSFRAFPYRVVLLNRRVLRQGIDMIRLGVYFTVASFFGSGAFSVIANYLMIHGGAETVGAYSAGYQLMSYLGMFVFSAMESDYYSRLSSLSSDRHGSNSLVNSQIEVALLLMVPMIVGFMVFLGPIVTLFLSAKFVDAVPMAQLAALSLFFKAATQPMAYMSLSKGDSKTFLLQEVLFDVFLVAAVVVCFSLGGLKYVGLAILLAGLFDMLVVGSIVYVRYGFRLSDDARAVFLKLPLPLVAAYFCVTACQGWVRWCLGVVLLAGTVALCYFELKKRTTFIAAFKDKLHRRLGR